MEGKDYDPPDSPRSVGWTEAQQIRLATAEQPFALEAGGAIGPVDMEYETYGKLNAARDNAILVLQALSGDAHVAGWDKRAQETGRLYRVRKPGWWDAMVGPGKPFDTNRFFVIGSNFLGSCYGTTGPSSTTRSRRCFVNRRSVTGSQNSIVTFVRPPESAYAPIHRRSRGPRTSFGSQRPPAAAGAVPTASSVNVISTIHDDLRTNLIAPPS